MPQGSEVIIKEGIGALFYAFKASVDGTMIAGTQ